MQPFGLRQIAAIALAGAFARREGIDALGHGVDVFDQVEHIAVVEEAAPLRVEPHQVELARDVDAGFGEHALQDARHGEDGGAHVEPKTVLFQHRRLAAEPFIGLEQHHPMPASGQRDRRGQAAEPAADDADRQVGGTLGRSR